MTDKLSASIILRIARPSGLAMVIRSAIRQDLSEPWELVIVDSACVERQEMVREYWDQFAPKHAELVHVPPLRPLPCRSSGYHCWDIPLFLNTGWAYARGQVCAHIEDYMAFEPSWLRRLVEFCRAHPNLAAIGHVYGCESESEVGIHDLPGHYGRARPELLRGNMSNIQSALDNPTSYKCVNSENYGIWLSGNLGLHMSAIQRVNGVIEYPTHYPESAYVAPLFFSAGISMYPLEGVEAWHVRHPSGQIIGHIAEVVDQNIVYQPVKMEHFLDITNPGEVSNFKRDLRQERISLGRWVD